MDSREVSNIAWAFALCRNAFPPLSAALSSAAMAMGAVAERARSRGRRQAHDRPSCQIPPLAYDTPTVALSQAKLLVLHKPAGWETDVYALDSDGAVLTPVARFYLLSSYLQSIFMLGENQLCYDVTHSYGFIHRLDQMSSGLILTATTYTAYYSLAHQMATYRVHREYVVLVHSLLGDVQLCVNERILEGAARGRAVYGERCRVGSRGKPAETVLSVLAHQSNGCEERYALLVISIFTGRQHQIRVHLQHIGAPVVYDGRYFDQAVVLRAFRQEASCALPTIPRISPLPPRHRWELWLRGAVPEHTYM